MSKKPQVRSRNGCFTCRRRKKKCDESSYPSCKNCVSNKLQCSWPDHVLSAHEKKQDVKRESIKINSDKVSSQHNSLSDASTSTLPPHSLFSENRVAKPERKGKNYILQRISMQQDCVEELQGGIIDFLDSVMAEPSSSSYLSAAPTSSIRERIGRQLDIPGEEIKTFHYDDTDSQI